MWCGICREWCAVNDGFRAKVKTYFCPVSQLKSLAEPDDFSTKTQHVTNNRSMFDRYALAIGHGKRKVCHEV
jgi:hypothetical protein